MSLFSNVTTLALAATLLLPSVASAQRQITTEGYAAAACETGCRSFAGDALIYRGATPKTYRICQGNGYTAEIFVEGTKVADLPDNRGNVRSCIDINGSTIGIRTSGVLLVGQALPG